MKPTLQTLSHVEDQLRVVPEVSRPLRTGETDSTVRPWWEQPLPTLTLATPRVLAERMALVFRTTPMSGTCSRLQR